MKKITKKQAMNKIEEILHAGSITLVTENVTEHTKLHDALFDSLDQVHFTMEFEKAFGISLKEDDISNLKTIGDCVNYAVHHAPFIR